jgi:hypothetical protein
MKYVGSQSTSEAFMTEFEAPTLVDLGSVVTRTLGGNGGSTADSQIKTGATATGSVSAATHTGSTPTR